MIAYLDSSVVLRVLLGQSNRLAEWKRVRHGVASALVETECLRTLDRLRLAGRADPAHLAPLQEAVYRLTERLEVVELTATVLRRAGQPAAVSLGTLDAIHLATAQLWHEARDEDLAFATHDGALALAARASGFRVIGT